MTVEKLIILDVLQELEQLQDDVGNGESLQGVYSRLEVIIEKLKN